jgi:hypothetical protein
LLPDAEEKKSCIFALVSLLDKIQNHLRLRYLRNRLDGQSRNRVSGSLVTARDVLVLYDASEEHQNKMAEEFFGELKKLDIRVKSIGYAKFKIVPHYCIPQLTRQFICKKDLDWMGVPRQSFLEDFLNEDVDLLISLDQDQDPVLQYLAAVSLARFKVGYHQESNLPWFDFLVGGTPPGDTKSYIMQLIHYLSIKST